MLSFSEALLMLRHGRRVTREEWNCADQFLLFVPGSHIRVEADRPLGQAVPELLGSELSYGPHIDIRTPDNRLTPWTATQADLLSCDWRLIDDRAGAR